MKSLGSDESHGGPFFNTEDRISVSVWIIIVDFALIWLAGVSGDQCHEPRRQTGVLVPPGLFPMLLSVTGMVPMIGSAPGSQGTLMA